MRSDMAKVIVERPRAHSSDRHRAHGYKRREQRTPLDELPKRERMWEHREQTRELNEHLGPLRRYLRKQVGRPWNKVYSEICQHIRLDSAVQSHVRDHVDQEVEQQVYEKDGKLYHASGYLRDYPLDQVRYGGERDVLYVHPRTGLLCAIHARRYDWPEKPRTEIDLGDGREYRQVDGIWYECLWAWGRSKAPEGARCLLHGYDARLVSSYCSRKRQLNGRELKKAGLVNEQLAA